MKMIYGQMEIGPRFPVKAEYENPQFDIWSFEYGTTRRRDENIFKIKDHTY